MSPDYARLRSHRHTRRQNGLPRRDRIHDGVRGGHRGCRNDAVCARYGPPRRVDAAQYTGGAVQEAHGPWWDEEDRMGRAGGTRLADHEAGCTYADDITGERRDFIPIQPESGGNRTLNGQAARRGIEGSPDRYGSRGCHDEFSLKEGRCTGRHGTEALVERGVVECKRNLLYVLHERWGTENVERSG